MQMDSSSVYPFKVQFEDIDGGGVVHHPTYLKFLERARCDALANIGLPFSTTVAQLIAPADKVLELLQVPHVDFFKVSKCYFKAIIRMVYIDVNILRPKQIPDDILQGIRFSTALNCDQRIEL